MVFLCSLVLAVLLAVFGGELLRRYSKWFYLGTAAVALFVVICAYSGLENQFPGFVYQWIYPIFSRSALSAAMFILVMYAGAMPNGSAAMKKLMPIRAQLSIMASILTLAHNIVYARTYFRALFVSPAALSWNMLTASVISLVMIAIMLPLFVTSFPAVRRKMKPKSWKRLQRFAYGFYGLMYFHILLVCLPGLKSGQASYLFTVALYSVIFLGYAAMRVMKALGKRNLPGYVKKLPAALAVCAFVVVCCLSGVQVYQVNAAYQDTLEENSEENLEENSEELAEQLTDEEETDALEDSGESEETAAADESGEEADPGDDADAGEAADDTADADSDASSSDSSSVSSSSDSSSSSGSSGSVADTSTEETESTSSTQEETAATVYKDGTYTGTSTSGYEGETITVTLTISGDTLTAFSATTDQLDTSYFNRAVSYINKKLLADLTSTKTCSGATKSSNGILDAVQNALAQAKN